MRFWSNQRAKLPMPLLKRYAGLLVPFFLAICLVGGYWIYWNRTASEIEARVRAALPAQAASRVTVSGFPYRLTLDLADPTVRAGNGVTFSARSFEATATPFNPSLWVMEGAIEPAFALPTGPLRPLKATNLKASLRLNASGLDRFSLTFDALEAQGEGGWRVGAGQTHLVSDGKAAGTIAFMAEFENLMLSKPLDGAGAILGQTVQKVRVAGPVEQGQVLFTRPADWRKRGGQFTLMAGDLIWGPISFMGGEGVLTLNEAAQWEGQIKGVGALKPEGMSVAGLTAPVSLDIVDGRVSFAGLPGLSLTDVFK
jgi:hypothetical protein